MTLEDYRWWASTPLDNLEVSVVIPTYDEAERIVPTIGAIASHLSTGRRRWELIVADDGSTDGTVEIVEALGLVNVSVAPAEKNTGKGDAVRRGVLAARGEHVLFADADQSTPIEQYEELLQALTDHDVGVAVGSRAHLDADGQRRSRLRRLMSWGLRTIAGRLVETGVTDTQCGFKLFTREAARSLFWVQRLDGFSFDVEILHLANRLGFGVVEVPVDWIDAPGSKVRPVKVAVAFVADLTRIRANQALGRYGHRRDRQPTGAISAPTKGRPAELQRAA